MQKMSKGPIVLSILIVTLGVGWLLTALQIGPGIDWIWTLGLGVLGVLIFALSGRADKFSIIFGPLLLISSVLSLFRQRGVLSVDVEVPLLVILVGILLFVSQLPVIPLPRWWVTLPSDRLPPIRGGS